MDAKQKEIIDYCTKLNTKTVDFYTDGNISRIEFFDRQYIKNIDDENTLKISDITSEELASELKKRNDLLLYHSS